MISTEVIKFFSIQCLEKELAFNPTCGKKKTEESAKH